MSKVVPSVKPQIPPMERFTVYDGTGSWKTEAHTHRQAALKYADRHYATPDTLRDELILVVIRERDGKRCAALLKSKLLVQWTAPQVEEAPQ